MSSGGELTVVVDGGVLRPERVLGLPDNTRLIIQILRVLPSAEGEAAAKKQLEDIRARGTVRLDEWHPTRDEMHERH